MVAGYIIVLGYDVLAVRFAGRTLCTATHRARLVVSCAFSNNPLSLATGIVAMRQVRRQPRWWRDFLAGIGHRVRRRSRASPAHATAEDIDRARPIVERSLRTYANLVYRRDKALIFSDRGNAFLMYGYMHRTCIAMGDPVGPPEESRALISRFHELSCETGRRPVFFEVRGDNESIYRELGLTLTKLGEEARVELARFDIDMRGHAELRQASARVRRKDCRFEIVPKQSVLSLTPELLRVSEAWLAAKATGEKGFSNASFDADYLSNFPVAVVRDARGVIAFANLWESAQKEELSVDLMRHVPDAPNGTMDYLFTEILLWGRQYGFRWFNFGVAPLSGLETADDVTLWDRVGTLLYRHGEHFYNFQGLRHYKEKFGPVWTPRYLASPGGLALPLVLLDITALVAGGVRAIVSRHRRAR